MFIVLLLQARFQRVLDAQPQQPNTAFHGTFAMKNFHCLMSLPSLLKMFMVSSFYKLS